MNALPIRPLGGLLILIAAPAAALLGGPRAPLSGELDPAEVRAMLDEAYAEWGRARVELDLEAYRRLLAPDFELQLDDERHDRAAFVEMISRDNGLRRFDVEILTLRPRDDLWEAVIAEKLEFERRGPDGITRKACSLWVTRDGWRSVEDGWQVVGSEALGSEVWLPGTPPPFADWDD